MKLLLPAGSTSVIAHMFVPDSTATDGGGKTGLAFGDFTVYYVRAGGTLTALTTETIATLGTYAAPTSAAHIRIKLLHDTNAPGLYEVQFHNDQLAAGANQATFMFRATGAAPTLIEIQLAGVLLASTQNAITWGQQIISANQAAQGALHLVNANATGYGLYAGGGSTGQVNEGTTDYGQANSGGTYGLYNVGVSDHGQVNEGALSGQYNEGTADTGTYNKGGATGFYNEGTTTYGIMAVGGTADVDPDWGAVTSIANNAVTAASIAADAIGSSELAATAVAEIAAAITAGATAAEVWAYASRTLTQSAASVTAAVSGSTITITRGDTLSAALTNIGALTGYVSLDFTVKETSADSDDNAILRIRKNASGTNDGLLRANKAAATATDGSITIDDEPTGDITIALAATVADDLTPQTGLYYDIQLITATAITTLSSGTCNIVADVTRAVV